jgi:hypothetical protein
VVPEEVIVAEGCAGSIGGPPDGAELVDGRSCCEEEEGTGGGGGGAPWYFSFLSRCLEGSLLPPPLLLFNESSPSLLGRDLGRTNIVDIK